MALSPRERNMVIFLVVIAVAAGAFFLLTSGGGDEPEDAAPPITEAPPTTPEPSPAPTVAPPGRKRPPPLTIVTGRDPFVPLIVAETGDTGTEPADVGEPPQEPDEPQEPIETPGPGAERRQQEGVTIGGRLVTLLDVSRRRGEDVAQVEVDGRTFTVSERERFAQNFRVVAIEGECATLLFGDETFRVCVPRQGK